MACDELMWDFLIENYFPRCAEGLGDICGDTLDWWFPNTENEYQVKQVHIAWPCQHDKGHNQSSLLDSQRPTVLEAAQAGHGMPFPKLLLRSVMVA